jgi:external thioesterase TEII
MQQIDLFLLHFAGGNIYSYNFLRPHLTGMFNFIPIELPGRGKRLHEELVRDKDKAVQDLLGQIQNRVHSNPFILYGHSMGAYLGYFIVKALEEQNRQPLCFVVTGNSGPSIKKHKQRYDLPKEKFIKELKILGGTDDEVFNNHDLFNFFEPVLRADFEIVERDSLTPIHHKISTPIYACMGTEEEYNDQVENWRNYTTNYFESELLDGNHFFIYKHPYKISKVIRQCVQRFLIKM